MTTSLSRRLWTTLPLFGATAVAAIVFAPTLGSTAISLSRAFDASVPWAENVDAQIFFVARLPRVLAAALVGAALASSGVVLQALLRNPLATPFTLGVSAGAALGAMLAIAFGLDLGALGVSSVPIASFVGSMAATGIVYWLASSQRRGLSTNVLLLAGVTLNSFFSALILFVQYLADFTQSFRTVRWLMGDLDVGSYGPLVAALPLLLLAFAAFAVLPRDPQPAHARHRRGRGPRCGRGARRTRGVRERVAGHRGGGLAGRADRLHRHRRAAPGAAAGRLRPPSRAAGLGPVRRGVPDRLRPGRRARRWRRSSCPSGSSRR